MPPKKWLATTIGIIALIFWSFDAVLLVSIGPLPVFEIQFIVFLSSFLLAFCRIHFRRQWRPVLLVPKSMWFIGVLGIYLANLFFVSAFRYAPAEKVGLINYLWPLMVILLSPKILKERFSHMRLVGVMVAFWGIFILLTNGEGLAGFDLYYWRGYLLSFFNACFWTLFVIYSRRYSAAPNDMIGLYSGVAACCALIGHCLFEHFVAPTMHQFVLLVVLGAVGQGIAYFFWDHGVKKGDYQLLCVLTYGLPILSTFSLVYFGFAQMSTYLVKAVLLVSIGAFIATPVFGVLLYKCKIWQSTRT